MEPHWWDAMWTNLHVWLPIVAALVALIMLLPIAKKIWDDTQNSPADPMFMDLKGKDYDDYRKWYDQASKKPTFSFGGRHYLLSVLGLIMFAIFFYSFLLR